MGQGIPEKKACYMNRSLERRNPWWKDYPQEFIRAVFESWTEANESVRSVRGWQLVEAVRGCELAPGLF